MRSPHLTLLLTGLFVALGCSQPVPRVPPVKPWAPYPKYNGQTRQAVEAALGSPAQTETYLLSEVGGEMRGVLFNTYPPSNPANANVQIVELWWLDGDYWITLWFHQVNGQWLAFESLRWKKSVRF